MNLASTGGTETRIALLYLADTAQRLSDVLTHQTISQQRRSKANLKFKFPAETLNRLEALFQEDYYPNPKRIERFAAQNGLFKFQVKNWVWTCSNRFNYTVNETAPKDEEKTEL